MRSRYGRYEVLRALGEGAMAAVHLARDPVLTRHVAVKVLHREVASNQVALKRFFNEAKTVANVRNPHVVEVFDFGREGRDYYLVMEFVDGQSLQGVLRQLAQQGGAAGSATPLDDLFTAALLCQAAEGLDIAGRHGVVHRDIKPENLMINTQGYLKIADFGIAHLQDESLTRTGAVLGSPLYMSPEQVRGAKPITSQSDMFSLGAVMYRCLAGVPPFAAPSLKDLYRLIAREPHVPLRLARPGMDPELADLVETLLAKDPARRGGGPRWLRASLRKWLMERGVADPMDLAASHLRGLSRQGVQTTWLGAGGNAIPRTVAATRPITTLRDTSGRGGVGPGATLAAPSRGPRAETVPPAAESGRPRRSLAWACGSLLSAGLMGLGAFVLAPDGSGDSSRGTLLEVEPGGRDQGPGADEGPDHGGYPSDPDGDPSAGGEKPDGAGIRETPPDTAPARAGHATLRILSAPPFAEVFLDGRSMGVTPLDLREVPPGPRRLTLRTSGGATLDTLLVLGKGGHVLRARLHPGAVALDEEE